MFCSHCGSRIGEGAKFCENCGMPTVHFQNPASSGAINGSLSQAAQIAGQNMSQTAFHAVHSVGKKAKYAAVIGIVIAGLTAFLNTYVSGPEQTLEAFCDACNEGNINDALDCLDETSEKTVRGTIDMTMGVVNGALDLVGLGGFGMDGDTVIDMMPGIWGMTGMSEEMPELSVTDVQVNYEGNEFLDFLKSVRLDLDGFYNVFAKEAEVEAVLEIDGESERIALKMENENFGKWKISLSDMLRESW